MKAYIINTDLLRNSPKGIAEMTEQEVIDLVKGLEYGDGYVIFSAQDFEHGWQKDMIDTSTSVLRIFEDDKPEYVWTFTAEQAADEYSLETITKVFATEKAAQKHLHDFVYGEEGELAYAEKRGWTIEHNEPDHFCSYKEGCYCSNHTEAVIEKQQVNH